MEFARNYADARDHLTIYLSVNSLKSPWVGLYEHFGYLKAGTVTSTRFFSFEGGVNGEKKRGSNQRV